MIVGMAAIPSCIIWSLLAKKWGYVRTLVLAMVIQSLGIAFPVIWMSPFSLVISALLFGATFMGITTLATTLGRQMNPENSNQVIGKLTAIYAVGQMLGPSIAGVLSSFTHDFDSALVGASSDIFIGACFLVSGIPFDRSPNENYSPYIKRPY